MNWQAEISILGPRLYRYFAASHGREAAADLTQETLIRLVQKQRSGAYDPGAGSLAMYAFGIARLVKLEAWKLQSRQGEQIPLEEGLPAPDSGDATVSLLRGSIAELEEPQREILLLYIDQELTLSDIGLLLGIPLNTVKSHVHRAKISLKEKMLRGKLE